MSSSEFSPLTISAGKVPHGLSEHDRNSEYHGVPMTAVLSVFAAIAFAFYITRIYTKIRVFRQPGWDDLVCTLGMIIRSDQSPNPFNANIEVIGRSLDGYRVLWNRFHPRTSGQTHVEYNVRKFHWRSLCQTSLYHASHRNSDTRPHQAFHLPLLQPSILALEVVPMGYNRRRKLQQRILSDDDNPLWREIGSQSDETFNTHIVRGPCHQYIALCYTSASGYPTTDGEEETYSYLFRGYIGNNRFYSQSFFQDQNLWQARSDI
ncbi:hypothetical protein EYC80_006539 [Monilinia laxa]|uniref:Uncharacterized protein n=1 Tax=Monilinia laxa TaxID=61186 RepID=A0A5N6JUZ7_MONLA|nr:hypothetical protein EYC80_006539 [Monilinia laxa]